MYITKRTLQICIVFTFAEAKGSVFRLERAPLFLNSLFLQWICHLWKPFEIGFFLDRAGPSQRGGGSGKRNLSSVSHFSRVTLKTKKEAVSHADFTTHLVLYFIQCFCCQPVLTVPLMVTVWIQCLDFQQRKAASDSSEKFAGLHFLKLMILLLL